MDESVLVGGSAHVPKVSFYSASHTFMKTEPAKINAISVNNKKISK